MQDYIYSVIAFVAMTIHLIINFGRRADRDLNAAHGAREYRGFLRGVFADNGREALEMLTAPGAPKFDFVLTDMWMPEMDGMKLVAAIRANPAVAKMKVYLFTAEVEMKDSYAQSGFNGILLKPANLESLRSLLP